MVFIEIFVDMVSEIGALPANEATGAYAVSEFKAVGTIQLVQIVMVVVCVTVEVKSVISTVEVRPDRTVLVTGQIVTVVYML